MKIVRIFEPPTLPRHVGSFPSSLCVVWEELGCFVAVPPPQKKKTRIKHTYQKWTSVVWGWVCWWNLRLWGLSLGHFKSSKEFYELTQLLRPFVGGEVPLAQRKSKNIQERPPDTFRGTTHRVLRLPRGCGQYGPQLKFQTSEQSGTEWRVQESDSLCFLSRQMDQMRNSQFNWFA